MTIFVHRHMTNEAINLEDVMRAMLQTQGRIAAAATAVTDNSGGVANGSNPPVLTRAGEATAVANAGTNLAQKASTEAALGTVRNALATLFAKTATANTKLGLNPVTYNGGGADGNGTVAAVTKSVTADAVGVNANGYNAATKAINDALYTLAVLISRVAVATGTRRLDVSSFSAASQSLLGSVPAISTDTGTAASPGVSKAKVDADLTVFANDVATLAAKLNGAIGGIGSLAAVAV